jgi:hypothetical protein
MDVDKGLEPIYFVQLIGPRGLAFSYGRGTPVGGHGRMQLRVEVLHFAHLSDECSSSTRLKVDSSLPRLLRPRHIRRGSGPVKPQSDVDDALASEVLRKVQRPASWPAQIQNSDFNGRFDKVARTATARTPLLASGAEAFPATLRHRQPCGRTWARAQALPPSFSPCLSSSILPSRDPAKARQRSDADFATARGERRGKGPVQPQSGAVDALQPRLRAAS